MKNGTIELGQGVVAGFDELVLKYSFELSFISPFVNDQLNYPVNQLELQFCHDAYQILWALK